MPSAHGLESNAPPEACTEITRGFAMTAALVTTALQSMKHTHAACLNAG